MLSKNKYGLPEILEENNIEKQRRIIGKYSKNIVFIFINRQWRDRYSFAWVVGKQT